MSWLFRQVRHQTLDATVDAVRVIEVLASAIIGE